eukprot:CAMPEP_0172586862 /NCGR_PEP_ID=MMETSP1068-20121228/6089_1 /TAXON_ID=35684 /ORGANISM="Pseudopedinella elastica, Strain CCMP716" /LENGTH=114 /DNA_ID=CAMNT_0013381745 /DNA_START=61 /DNA_END=405 /DNA_ORIENTATION=+
MSKAVRWMQSNSQPLFNIGMSFLMFSLAGQVYTGKLERHGIEQKANKLEGIMRKVDILASNSQKSSSEIRRDLNHLVAEAKGNVDILIAAEQIKEYESSNLTPKPPSEKPKLML